MAVVLHVTAEGGSRLWQGFAGQGGLCFQEGSGSKPEPYSVEVSRAGFSFCPRCCNRLQLACPHCQRSVDPGDKFCPHCGGALESAAGVSSTAATSQP